MTREEAIRDIEECVIPYVGGISLRMAVEALKEQRPHGEWEALGFQQGYAFCRCSNCHKTMRLYRDSKNEFCCIADIRKKVVSCMYCGADMSANDRQVTGKLKEEPKDSHAEYWNSIGEWKEGEAE